MVALVPECEEVGRVGLHAGGSSLWHLLKGTLKTHIIKSDQPCFSNASNSPIGTGLLNK